MRLVLCFSILFLLPSTVLACYATPKEQMVPADELIKRTESIVLARVVAANLESTDGRNRVFHTVNYEFELIEVVKGESKEKFSLNGRPLMNGQDATSFSNHKDERFWDTSEGRVFRTMSCTITPSFAVGSSYLLFLDKPYHQKSFELVNAHKPYLIVTDKWLEYVKSKINE